MKPEDIQKIEELARYFQVQGDEDSMCAAGVLLSLVGSAHARELKQLVRVVQDFLQSRLSYFEAGNK